MNKKILIVTNGFYPENSPRSLRATELAVELAKQGNAVKVITHYRDGINEFCHENGIEFKNLGKLTWPVPTIKGTGIIRLFWRAITRFSSLWFAYPLIQIVPLVKKVLNGESNYDLLISVAVPYPIHWGVALARKNNNQIAKVWVADCGDPYMGQENDTFKPPFYFGWVEKWFCRKANYISIPFEGARTAYYKKFHNKIKIIPQGLSFPELSQNNKKNEVITFAYAGNIVSYLHYALPFFNYLNTIETDFRFHIYTIDKDVYLNNLNEKTLSKCIFNDYKDRKTLLTELNNVDFLLHFPYKIGIQKSLKLVDYFYLSKPVLSFVATQESHNALEEFLKYDFKNQMQIDNVEAYYIKNVANQFLELTQ